MSDEASVALALEESVVVALEKLASMPPAKEAASLTGLLGTGSADGVLTKCHAFVRVNGIVGIQTVVRCPKRPIEEVRDGCCCFCFVFSFAFSCIMFAQRSVVWKKSLRIPSARVFHELELNF